MRSITLLLLQLSSVHACGGCRVGPAAAHVALTSTAGELYVEFDNVPSGSCAPSHSAAAIAKFSTGALTPTKSMPSMPDHEAYTARVDFGTPSASKTLDVNQPASGAVSISGVQFPLPGLTEKWSSCRGYVWSWWYSPKLGRYYFVYPTDCMGRTFTVCTESPVSCTDHTPPEDFYTFDNTVEGGIVWDELGIVEVRMGVSVCTNSWYFYFNETYATSIPFLNDNYQHNLRPPAVYDASEGNVYTFAMPFSMDGGAQLVRYNLNTGATDTVDISTDSVNGIIGSGLGTGALIGIIASAVVLVLLLTVLFVRMRKRKKAGAGAA